MSIVMKYLLYESTSGNSGDPLAAFVRHRVVANSRHIFRLISRLKALTSWLWDKLISDVTGLDKRGTLGAIFQFAIAFEMYSGVGHIIK
jgi:hypothetical protein